MRLPFLQMESDLLAHGAPQVASLAGCLPVQALGHIAFLRAWAVAQATDESPPDGWARGEDASAAIEAAAQWAGEPGRLLRALKVAKLVEVTPEGVRVLGLEPYVVAWNKNAKAKERMANARARSANVRVTTGEQASSNAERSAKFGRQMQTQMEDVEAEENTASQSAPPEASPQTATETLSLAVGNLPAPEEAAKKPPKPKKPPTAVAEFGEWCIAERAKAVPATAVDDTKLRPDQWARLGEAHKDHGRKLLEAAFQAFLAAPYPRSRDCPLGLFVGQLEKWMTEGKSAGAAANDTKPTKFLVL